MKPSETQEIVAILEAAYPNVPTKAGTGSAFWLALRDIPAPLALLAVDDWITYVAVKPFPRPAELRDAALRIWTAPRRYGLPPAVAEATDEAGFLAALGDWASPLALAAAGVGTRERETG